MRPFYEVLVDELGGLKLLAGKNELAHLRQRSQRLTTIVIVGRTAPEGFFVELDFLRLSATIDHRS